VEGADADAIFRPGVNDSMNALLSAYGFLQLHTFLGTIYWLIRRYMIKLFI
jgi:hypothetical protein